MRVTVINFYGKGGMLYYATELANALTPRCDVRLVLPRKYPGFYRGLNDRVELVQVVVPEDFSRRNLVRLPVYATAFPVLVKRILEGRPDIVHVTNENIWLTGLAPFIGNHRLVWTLHDPIPHLGDSIRKKIATRILARFSRRIFVHYKYNFKMAESQGYDPSKLVVIPHGNYSFYEKYGKPGVRSRRMVLFWGRIRAYKGVETLIDCARFLADDVEIVIAGEGAGIYRPTTANDSRITLIDRFLTDEEIAELCQQCSVVATPYVEATQSGIVPVAYAFSKPVVTTDVGALPEQVEDGITGLVVPPNQPELLARAITKILNDPMMAADMGSAGYRKSHTDMNWDKVTDIVCSTYEQVLHAD